MILIIESGSTKSDWVLLNEGERTYFSTIGLNPYFHNEDDVEKAIRNNTELYALKDAVSEVYFYGAGCSADHLNAIIKSGIQRVYSHASVAVDHDLNACAYATYSGEPAISCIIGTGSNSCFFDGERISEKVPALGYILGDEGSGTYMGKRLLADYLYHRLPEEMATAFRIETGLDKDGIVNHVYKEPNANVYLASFVPFIQKFSETNYVKELVLNGFKQFLQIHVCCFDNYQDYPVHFVGSISRIFKNELEQACMHYNIKLGNIVQKPVDGLVQYHERYINKLETK
jgi:N-acetylglucosamine kinase-like BadF-type ATPase